MLRLWMGKEEKLQLFSNEFSGGKFSDQRFANLSRSNFEFTNCSKIFQISGILTKV